MSAILSQGNPGRNPGPFAVRPDPAERASTTSVAARKKRLDFAALPHALREDPRLSRTQIVIAAVLLSHARDRAVCWPSDATIGRGAKCSPGHAQRGLRGLEAAGWIRREKAPFVKTRDGRTIPNRTNRLIVLRWEADGDAPDAPGARPDRAPAREAPRAPARDKRDVIVKAESSKGSETPPERSRPEPPPPSPPARAKAPLPPQAEAPMLRVAETPKAPRAFSTAAPGAEAPAPAGRPSRFRRLASREEMDEFFRSNDRIGREEAARKQAPPSPRREPPATVPELLARIREDPANVQAAAELLAQDLGDRKSWSGFHAACRRAWEGEIPAEALVIAHREATSGKADNPGAVFMHVLKREAAAYHRRC